MYRSILAIALAAVLSIVAGAGLARDATAALPGTEWSPRSGDAWVDGRLADINQYGSHYRDAFVDEMTRYYSAPPALVGDLLDKRNWAPGDIYYACAIAQVIGQPCRRVVDAWEQDHAQGWGALAQRLGVQPGSAEFHRLKKGFVPSYDHWGRPITLDDELRADFPQRGHGNDDTVPASPGGDVDKHAVNKHGHDARTDAHDRSDKATAAKGRGRGKP